MRLTPHVFLVAFFISLPLAAAHAACTSPIAEAGSQNWNGTAFQFCDGTVWRNFGESHWSTGASSAIYYNIGNVGIGTAAPATTLDVAGTATATSFDIGRVIATFAGASGTSSSAGVACAAAKKPIGGGCYESSSGCQVFRSFPTTSGWQCNSVQWNGSSTCTVTAYAICANVP